jgi:hypothetical protein
VDVKASKTNDADADGEVVWSWRPKALAPSPSEAEKLRGGDGGKRDGSPRRARISRKPPRREGRLLPPVPVVFALAQISFAREPRVQRPPGLPCALCSSGGWKRCKARTNSVARMRTCVLSPVIARSVRDDCVRRSALARRRKQSRVACVALDCFAEPVIGPAKRADPLAGDDSGASCCLTAESETERVPQAALTAFAFTGGIARKEIASLFQALMVAISMVRFTVSASENCVRTS